MITTHIRASGLLDLGPEARAQGYTNGCVVEVCVLSSGSVLVRLSDEQPLDLRGAVRDHTPIAGSRLALYANDPIAALADVPEGVAG